MKINIITQPLFCNYGGILQNYALQEVLRRMGHEPLTLNPPPNRRETPYTWIDNVRAIRNYLRKLTGNYNYPFYHPKTCAEKEWELSFPQREFIQKHINKVDVALPFGPCLTEKYPADAWIVGSDQVWRPWCSPNINNYFFDFLEGKDTKRISYAASFGTDNWEISQQDTPRINELAAKFDAISVREQSGVGLCERYLGVSAVQVLDPTLLLDADDYLKLTENDEVPKEKYIATYILDSDKQKREIIKNISKIQNIKVIEIGKMRKNGFDSIESWLANIANAEMVITDSFHGTVFAIIFNKPIKLLKNPERGNTRLESLLNILNLKEDQAGILYPSNETVTHLERIKEISTHYLRTSLNSKSL